MANSSVFPSLFFFFFLVSHNPFPAFAYSFTEFVFPNFTATNVRFIDNGGAFLFSRNGSFKAAISNPGGQQTRFYLCVIHSASGTVIWSANRDGPISNSGTMAFTRDGISISDHDGTPKWSIPNVPKSSAAALQLTESGNLVLLDKTNTSLWESFDNPADTLVAGQILRKNGNALFSSVSGEDFSTGDYRLGFSDSDVILGWRGQSYWKLSMDPRAYTDSTYPVDSMAVNGTGLFLFGRNGSIVVARVALPPAEFRIARLVSSGQFIVSSFSHGGMKDELDGPNNVCQIPSICGEIGWCSVSTGNNPTCQCPPGFRSKASNSDSFNGCVPSDSSSSLVESSCSNNGSQVNSSSPPISYLSLGNGMDYFALDFSQPRKYALNLSACQEFCTTDCACLGIFYDNSSGSCYTIENDLGSVMSSRDRDNDQVGYIKTVESADKSSSGGNRGAVNETHNNKQFPLALVLLPCIAVAVVLPAGFVWWRRWKIAGEKVRLSHANSFSSDEMDAFYIPGLPQRFDYEELDEATDRFKMQIGSGGFGSVYKGVLSDKSVVAVKKITNVGIQGKRDFCTEIAIIGNVHHVNLVKLRGFCAQGRQRLLVYEYMNRGSLDRTLFASSGPVLEWQERFEIALGTARGLAYLHTGCEHKIIHCDVKPENILLQEQFQAKISDFGLSKLLGPEQSSLFTTMRGTRGYLAPEWLTNSAISEKTDVYSYGMVLLELVSGRKNCSIKSASPSQGGGQSTTTTTSSQFGGMVYFPLVALEMHEQRRYVDLADARLEGRVRSEEVEKLVRVALCCVHEEPCLRPSMVSVVGMLEGGISLGEPRMESLNFLRFYGRRFAEASILGEEGNNEQREALLNSRQEYGTSNYSSTISDPQYIPLSFISSQQISGPR
ncbi:unnamed protein product [Linum trigynum]|uniref:Receptor-like serine/threonine-protein kinase n=1 Tax=Linum trigynum TaxID=586398 RepID=A0AAV2D1L0_9ROSI